MAKNTLAFSDETIVPNDELLFSIIGDKELIWKQTMSYLNDNNNNITEVWKFYKDGKSWLLRTTKKKKTIFWIRILNDTFRIAFWFAVKLEPIILESKLPQRIKEEYLKSKIFNKSRSIHIDVRDSLDFEIIKTLIDLKTENL
jgi:hypothetical protein